MISLNAVRLAKKVLLSLWLAIFFSCKDDSGEIAGTPQLDWDNNSLPSGELLSNGGAFSLNVDWAFTQWNILVDEVLEGVNFIDQITPSTAGGSHLGATNTRVNIIYKSNPEPSQNVLRLELRAVDGSISRYLELTQAATEFEPLIVSIDPSTTYQTISGFGGGNMMWGSDFLDANEIKLAFGTGPGELGLTLYRVRLSPFRSEWPRVVETVKEARKYGAKIIASPWSPPIEMKSNNAIIGGRLLTENYEAYATYLNDFVQFMASQGAPVDVVSIQNEPDIQVSYESCDWTPGEILDFIKNYAPIIKNAKITAAESFNFNQSYTDQILNDPVAVNNLDIVSGHIYGSGLAPYPLATQKGKEVWMTEYLMNQNSGADINNWNLDEQVIWGETMEMLETIHRSMESNWNAYIWWYIRRFYSFLGEGELGTTRGQTLRRGHAMAQFAKYVRPGYVRIGTTYNPAASNLSLTAYEGDGKTVVVLINKGEQTVPLLEIQGLGEIRHAKSYTTSVLLLQEEKELEVEDQTVSLNLPPKSITTVVIER